MYFFPGLGFWAPESRPTGIMDGLCQTTRWQLPWKVSQTQTSSGKRNVWMLLFFFQRFTSSRSSANVRSTSRAHPVLQVLPAHRDLLALRAPKWPRKFFSRSSRRWSKVETSSAPLWIKSPKTNFNLCLCPVRGYREKSSSSGQTNQPQPAAHSPPDPGGDDLVPADRGGFPLQAEGPSAGG